MARKARSISAKNSRRSAPCRWSMENRPPTFARISPAKRPSPIRRNSQSCSICRRARRGERVLKNALSELSLSVAQLHAQFTLEFPASSVDLVYFDPRALPNRITNLIHSARLLRNLFVSSRFPLNFSASRLIGTPATPRRCLLQPCREIRRRWFRLRGQEPCRRALHRAPHKSSR